MKELAQFHDGYLTGVLIEQGDAKIFLSTRDRVDFILQVKGVHRLRVDAFREGNIIFDIVVRQGPAMKLEDVVEAFGFTDETGALQKLTEAQRENCVFLEISSSYGASGFALANSIDLAKA